MHKMLELEFKGEQFADYVKMEIPDLVRSMKSSTLSLSSSQMDQQQEFVSRNKYKLKTDRFFGHEELTRVFLLLYPQHDKVFQPCELQRPIFFHSLRIRA